MLADFHPAYSIGVRCRLGYAEARPRATLPTLIDMYGRERCANLACRAAHHFSFPRQLVVRPSATLPILIYMHRTGRHSHPEPRGAHATLLTLIHINAGLATFFRSRCAATRQQKHCAKLAFELRDPLQCAITAQCGFGYGESRGQASPSRP